MGHPMSWLGEAAKSKDKYKCKSKCGFFDSSPAMRADSLRMTRESLALRMTVNFCCSE